MDSSIATVWHERAESRPTPSGIPIRDSSRARETVACQLSPAAFEKPGQQEPCLLLAAGEEVMGVLPPLGFDDRLNLSLNGRASIEITFLARLPETFRQIAEGRPRLALPRRSFFHALHFARTEGAQGSRRCSPACRMPPIPAPSFCRRLAPFGKHDDPMYAVMFAARCMKGRNPASRTANAARNDLEVSSRDRLRMLSGGTGPSRSQFRTYGVPIPFFGGFSFLLSL